LAASEMLAERMAATSGDCALGVVETWRRLGGGVGGGGGGEKTKGRWGGELIINVYVVFWF